MRKLRILMIMVLAACGGLGDDETETALGTEYSKLSCAEAVLAGRPIPPDCSTNGPGAYCGCNTDCDGHVDFSSPSGLTPLGCDTFCAAAGCGTCTATKYYKNTAQPVEEEQPSLD
jgi:hypothetical protein